MTPGMVPAEAITSLHHGGKCHTPMVHQIKIEEGHRLTSPGRQVVAGNVPSHRQCQEDLEM